KVSNRLYQQLVTPLNLSGDSTLVLVPDGPLVGLPFAALQNPASGKFLVEERPVAYAPSLGVLAQCFAGPREPGDVRVLALGYDGRRWQPWEPLPEALEEGRAVARILGGRMTADTDVTRQTALQALGAMLFWFAGHVPSANQRMFGHMAEMRDRMQGQQPGLAGAPVRR